VYTGFQGWWTSVRDQAIRLKDGVSATWSEATEGRSYPVDYRHLDVQELFSVARIKQLPLDGTARYVITSDHHRKHERNPAEPPESTFVLRHRNLYQDALTHYAKEGFTLIEAGDMEELWRLGLGVFSWTRAWERIKTSYGSLYDQIRTQFVQEGRYVRLWGNHDAVWRHDKYRHQHLTPVLGESEIYEMAAIGGRYLIMHGHAVDRWNNDRRGWWVGRVLSKTPIHIDAVNYVVADPDGTYPNWVGGRHRDSWLACIQERELWQSLMGNQRFHPIRAVECDLHYIEWANRIGMNLICGHTHEPALFPTDRADQPTPYVNCGSGMATEELQAVEIAYDGIPRGVKWTPEGRQELNFRS